MEPLLKQPPPNNPWDLTGLYDTLGTASAVNNDFGGFLGGLDAFNGFANPQSVQSVQQNVPPSVATVLANTGQVPPTPQQDPYMTPVMGMTPNVTPSKSDYGDYSNVAPGLPMMSTAPPGAGSSSAGKKMGYLDQQPMTGLAGRGDPTSVRRNMVRIFEVLTASD